MRSIHAAISDGQGGALLVGTDGPSSDTRAWFGAIDERGRVTSSVGHDVRERGGMVDVLAGPNVGERALLLGNVGTEGWVVSVDARGALRWQSHVGPGSPAQLLAGVRIPGEHGDVLAVGMRPDVGSEAAWWDRLAGSAGAEAKFDQGEFEVAALRAAGTAWEGVTVSLPSSRASPGLWIDRASERRDRDAEREHEVG